MSTSSESNAPLERAGRIFAQVIEHDTADQDDVLMRLCGEDNATAQEVASLLAARRSMGGFLETPALDRPNLYAPGDKLAGYEIIRLLGSGGAGDVYEAQQRRPDRRVALKVMRAGIHSERARDRFFEEAQTLADLNHPGIAHIYDIGVHASRPYLVMEYVEDAKSLLDYGTSNALSRDERLTLFARVCDAVHFAHQKRVVHRDLKPENILLDKGGNPKVIDFGIAAMTGNKVERTGTLPYMSPQQRSGATPSDVRDDVFALGIVLGELASDDPSKDMSAIVARATEQDVAKRYDSVAALRGDVHRLLAGHTVDARNAGWLDHLAKFAKRHKLGCAALLLSALLLIGGAIGGSLLAIEKDRQRASAALEAYRGNIAAASAALRVGDVAEARRNLENTSGEHRGWEWYHLWERIDESDAQLTMGSYRPWCGAGSNDGAVFAAGAQTVGSQHWRVRVWRAEDHSVIWDHELDAKHRVDALSIQTSPPHIALGRADGDIEIYNYESGNAVGVLQGHSATINDLAFAGPARLFSASRDRTIAEWDVSRMARVREYRGHTDRVIGLAVHPEQGILASGGREGHIRLWDLQTGETTRVLSGHESSVECVALDPTGTRLVSTSRDETVRLWDLERGVQLHLRRDHSNNVRSVAFAPNGTTFATGSWDRTVRIWRASDAHPLRTLRGHRGDVTSVSYLDANALVSFARDDDARIWDLDSLPYPTVLRGHLDVVRDCTYVNNGMLITLSFDGVVKTWEPEHLTCIDTWNSNLPRALCCAASADWIVATNDVGVAAHHRTEDRTARLSQNTVGVAIHKDDVHIMGSSTGYFVWNAKERKPRLMRPPGIMRSAIALSPGGHRAWAGTSRGFIEPLSVNKGKPAATHAGRVMSLAYHDRTNMLGSSSSDGTAAISDADTLRVIHHLRGHVGTVYAIAFAPDGKRVATGGRDGTVRLWDTSTGKQMAVLHGHRFAVRTLAFSPDGQSLASGGGTDDVPGTVRVWRAPGYPRSGR